MSEIDANLDSIIREAVDAKIQASVLAALSGDEVLGRYVTAALQRPVEVPKADGYGKVKVPFLSHVMETAMRDATKKAIEDLLLAERPRIEAEVAKLLRKQSAGLAAALVQSLADAAEKTYGVSVTLKMPGR